MPPKWQSVHLIVSSGLKGEDVKTRGTLGSNYKNFRSHANFLTNFCVTYCVTLCSSSEKLFFDQSI